MTYPTITPLPAAPVRNQAPADFSQAAGVFVAALPTMVTQTNAAGEYIDLAVINAGNAKTGAESARDSAQGFANAASNFASTATTKASESEGWASAANGYAQMAGATANFKGLWGDLTGPLNIPASVYHDGAYWQLLNDLADVTLSEPGVTGDWLGTSPQIITWQPIAANATLPANGHYAVDFTAVTELTLPGSPGTNDTIDIYVKAGDPIGAVIKANGKTIMGAAEDLNIDTNITSIRLVYSGTDWRIL